MNSTIATLVSTVEALRQVVLNQATTIARLSSTIVRLENTVAEQGTVQAADVAQLADTDVTHADAIAVLEAGDSAAQAVNTAQNATIVELQTDALDLAEQVATNAAACQNATAAAGGGSSGSIDCGVLRALTGAADGCALPTMWTGDMAYGLRLDIAMAPYFRSVRTLTGALTLDGQQGGGLEQLVSLRGLFPNLVIVTGDLLIEKMPRLVNLEGAFPVLESVSRVRISINPQLVRGNPFPSLREFTYTGDRTAVGILVNLGYNQQEYTYPADINRLLTCTVVNGWFGALQGSCAISQCTTRTNNPNWEYQGQHAYQVTMSGC